MIRCRCVNCEALLGLEDHLAGHRIKCPRCGAKWTVPPPTSDRPGSPRSEIHVVEEPPAKSDDPLAAIAQAETGGAGESASSHAHHGHGRHHPRPRKKKNTATLVVVIAVLMATAFGIGLLVGSGYRSESLRQADRLLPPGHRLDQYTLIESSKPEKPAEAKTAAAPEASEPPQAAVQSIKPMQAEPAAADAAANVPVPGPKQANDPMRYAIVSVGFSAYQDEAAGSRIQFWVSNTTKRVIKQVAGRVQVYDAADEHLADLELTYDDEIPVDGSGIATETWQLDQALARTFKQDAKSLKLRFETDTVTYADGTRDTFQ